MSDEVKFEKHPDVIAWDEFEAASESVFVLHTLTHPEHLRNRLWLAFEAGMKAARETGKAGKS